MKSYFCKFQNWLFKTSFWCKKKADEYDDVNDHGEQREHGDSNSSQMVMSLDNPIFCCYIFWASILLIKILLMSLLTIAQKIRNRSLSQCEELFKNVAVQFENVHVERACRAHRNDIENVLPYLITSLIYISTNPNPKVAKNLFRVASIARIVHTMVYAVFPLPPPLRVISSLITYVITIYMACEVAAFSYKYF